MEEFRKVVDDYNLIDMGNEGVKYTSCNRREENNVVIFERLDRCLAY